jgi:hypothetical protein
MIKSLGPGLDSLDFLRIALGNQHLFIVIQNSNLSKPLVLTWPQLLQQIQDQLNVVAGGVTSVNGETGVVVLALDDLSDVNAGSPTSGQFLQWNGSEWIPSTVAPGGVTSVNGDIGPAVVLNLGNLNDVSSTAPSTNQILQWDGSEWIPATISTGVYTADNGLSVDPSDPNNFELGSASSPGAALLNDRYINTGSTFGLYLQGQKTNQSDAVLFINNTASGGTGLSVNGSGLSLAIRAESTDSQGVYGISNTSVGILGQTSATSQGAILASVTSSASNLVALGLRIRHLTSAGPVAGLGVSIDFRGGTTINPEASLGRLMYQWTDAVTASRTSKFQIETVNGATGSIIASVNLEVLGSGQLVLNKYTTSTSFSTGLTSQGLLNVDNSGKVFVSPAPTGTGTVNSISPGIGLAVSTDPNPITISGSISLNSKLAPADNLTGNAGKLLAVNSTETAVEYVTAPTGTGDSVSPFLLMGG